MNLANRFNLANEKCILLLLNCKVNCDVGSYKLHANKIKLILFVKKRGWQLDGKCIIQKQFWREDHFEMINSMVWPAE